MADEPNKQMDQLLRDYARERRRGPDPRLHPATRQLLQAEVARTYGKPARPPFWSRLRAFWPQIAFGAGLGAIFLVAALSLRQPRPALEEAPALKTENANADEKTSGPLGSALPALNAPAQPTDKDQAPARELKRGLEEQLEREVVVRPSDRAKSVRGEQVDDRAAAGLASAVKSERDQLAASPQGANRALDSAAPSTLAAGSALAGRLQLGEQAAAPAGSYAFRRAVPQETPQQLAKTLPSQPPASKADAAVPAAPQPVPVSRALAASGVRTPLIEQTARPVTLQMAEAASTSPLVRARFVELSEPGQPQISAILTSFQVEQRDQNLTIVDQDGSVYSGSILSRPGLEQQNALGLDPSLFGWRESSNPAANFPNSAIFYFQAQGTNRTSGEQVVLTGRYLEKTNFQAAEQRARTVASKRYSVSTNALEKAHRAILGRATIGQTTNIPVRAVSVDQ